MLHKTNAIVLHRIKYGENGLVVSVYTQEFGFKTYFVRSIATGNKGKLRLAYFLPFQVVELLVYASKGSLQTIKEVSVKSHYTSLHVDLHKQSISVFLCEILLTTLQNDHTDSAFYIQVNEMFQWLDQQEHFANFHLYFIKILINHLGFLPENCTSEQYFDLTEGRFYNKPVSSNYIEGELLQHFKYLVINDLDTVIKLPLTRHQRNELLEILLKYLQLHQHSFRFPKSLSVLKELFQ